MKYVITLLLSILSFGLFVNVEQASANFNAGRIIDDSVMTDHNSMSTNDIQRFLESKVTCDTWGTKPSEYGGGTRAQYAASRGWQSPPYYCMTTYKENNISAAQLIYDKAQKYRISPKVLIVLLQKEQGLITDEWPLYSPQYKTATGYGCPDTAPCDSQYFGLANQLDWAAKMFRSIMDASPGWYTPYVVGNNYIQYSPTASCGGSTVYIQNRATQALYNYTPYQPNQAALSAGWGQAPCGAYGNRNFYLYYTSWFGSTQAGPAYRWSLESMNVYSDSGRTSKINEGKLVTLQPGQTAYARVQARNMGSNAWTDQTLLQTTNPPTIGNGSWLEYNKVARLTSYPVAYNQIGIYDFTITAPAAGSYHQLMNLNHGGSIWLNEPALAINVDSVPAITAPATTDEHQLTPGETMTNGQSMYSPERHSVLRFENGQLSLYVNFKKVWGTTLPQNTAKYFINQHDGNLVLYDANWKPLWATGTASGQSTLYMQHDGNVVLNAGSGAVWATNTAIGNQLLRVNYTLPRDGIIYRSQTMTTADRKYNLLLQNDGNLVLYNGAWQPLWASNTDGKGGDRLVMQRDGNVVLYTKDWQPVWATNTDDTGDSALFLQADRNLVLYNAVRATWASNTTGR